MTQKLKTFILSAFVTIISLNSFANIDLSKVKEEDKAQTVKELLKGIEFEAVRYPNEPERDKFCQELLPDFLAQKNIEYLKPIATGENINSPEIAKYNTACPEKFPINVRYYNICYVDDCEPINEYEIDPGYYKAECLSNMRIYRPDETRGDYILYCEDDEGDDYDMPREERKKIKSRNGSNHPTYAYILFNPQVCKMGKGLPIGSIREHYDPSYISGLIKYGAIIMGYAINKIDKYDIEIKNYLSSVNKKQNNYSCFFKQK